MTKKPEQSPSMQNLTWPTYAYVCVPADVLYERQGDGSQDEERYNSFLRRQHVKVEGYYHPYCDPKPWP